MICILLIFLIILLLYKNCNIYENYDSKISNVSQIECGNKCTSLRECHGFGYKPFTKQCYLSKDNIIAKPNIDSKYKPEYTISDKRCSKINYMRDNKRIDNITLTQNSVYQCADNEFGNTTLFQYANDNENNLQTVNSTIYDSILYDYEVPKMVNYRLFS